MSKQIPILFSTEMVRAILDNRKTMTRRIVKDEIPFKNPNFGYTVFTPPGHISVRGNHENGLYGENFIKCKWEVDAILYVRESHYSYGHWAKNGKTKAGKQKFKFIPDPNVDIIFGEVPDNVIVRKNIEHISGWYKRNSLFLPKNKSRIWLEITNIKVERLQDISEEDAKKEGIANVHNSMLYKDYLGIYLGFHFAINSFKTLWQHINGIESWSANPWVFAIEYKVLSTTGKL